MGDGISDKLTFKRYFQVHYSVLVELIKNYKNQSILLLMISILMLSSDVISLLIVQYLTNVVSVHINEGIEDYDIVVAVVGTAIIMLFVIQILRNIADKITLLYSDKISLDIEKKIVSKLSEIPYELYESQSFYEKINLANQVSSQYHNAIYAISQIIQIIITLFVYAVLLAKLHWLYILVAFLSLVISSIIATKTTDLQLDFWRKNVSPSQRTKEYFQGIYSNKINHSCNQVNRNLSFFIQQYETYIHKERKQYLWLNFLSFISEFGASLLFIITFLATIIITGKLVVEGDAEIGYFTMVMVLLVNLYNTIKRFSMFMMSSNWYVKVVESYNEILCIEHGVARNMSSEPQIEGILIDSLKYKYPQATKYSISNINQEFHFGEKIAVVGYNGSGKTTFISVICDLLLQYEGVVEKNCVSTVSIGQDFGEYQLSIRENIQLGRGGKKMNENEIDEILVKIGLKELVDALPDGIDTNLGQLNDGIDLSKGQWQRLAIGRLLANSEANVWVLDEPTAYLDPIAEINLYKLILALSGKRLVFFISHRLGFAQYADRIIVLKDGELVENGTHEELMKQQEGLYSKMFEAQCEWYK